MDDLDREYLNNTNVISLIHYIHSIIMENKSPQERIENFENLLKTDKSKITSVDFYFYYNSLINQVEKENNISKTIEMCEQENDYKSNLSYAINYIIPSTDNRVGINLEYIWRCSNSRGLDDDIVYQKIESEFSKQKFLKLNNANIANLLERETYTKHRKYINYIKEDDYSAVIQELINHERPYKYFEIFGSTEKIASKSQMEEFIIQYRNYLQTINEKYNYYTEDPFKGKRKDKNDKDLNAYNKYLENVDNLYDIDISNYYFSFED